MNPETFERKLGRQQMRQVPPEWRAEILCAARKAEPSRHSSPALRHSLLSTLNQQLSTFLWPHPRAWGALAAAWLVIFAANIASRDDSTVATRQMIPPSPQMWEMLREQEQLLAELVEEKPAANRPKALPPRPQSFYRSDCLSA